MQSLDLAFWDAVKGSSDPAELKAYLDQFPAGTFAPLARTRIATLSTPKSAPPAETPPAMAITAPATVPSVAPKQLAALPSPPPTALPPGTFDGRYTATWSTLRGDRAGATIDIEGSVISGFVPVGRDVCRIGGAIDAAGTIRTMAVRCETPANFTGRFLVDAATGQVRAETELSRAGDATSQTVIWAKK